MSDKKIYTITLEFTSIAANSPLDAAKEICKWVLEDAQNLMYDVIDEETNEKFSVDLSEEDEDAVLPNN